MKTAEEIQDDYAESKGFNTFYELLRDDLRSSDYHVDKVQKIYAKQVAEQVLKDAAENAFMLYHCGHFKRDIPTKHHQVGANNIQIHKQSILSTPIVTP